MTSDVLNVDVQFCHFLTFFGKTPLKQHCFSTFSQRIFIIGTPSSERSVVRRATTLRNTVLPDRTRVGYALVTPDLLIILVN